MINYTYEDGRLLGVRHVEVKITYEEEHFYKTIDDELQKEIN